MQHETSHAILKLELRSKGFKVTYSTDGASGFIGSRVQELLIERGYRIRALTRKASVVFPSPIDRFVGDLTDKSVCREGFNVHESFACYTG